MQRIGIFYRSLKTSAQKCLKNVDLFIASRDASNAENIGKTCILLCLMTKTKSCLTSQKKQAKNHCVLKHECNVWT